MALRLLTSIMLLAFIIPVSVAHSQSYGVGDSLGQATTSSTCPTGDSSDISPYEYGSDSDIDEMPLCKDLPWFAYGVCGCSGGSSVANTANPLCMKALKK